MRFEFATAARIVFGVGALSEAAPTARSFGTRALLVTGRSPERAERLRSDLCRHGLAVCDFAVPGEPTLALVGRGVQAARQHGCDLVVALGGGSAIDAGKAIAALLTNPGDPLDYLEVIGAGKSLRHPAAPFIAIPTTAGAGAEVTRNAVLASPEHGVKASLRSPLMLPRLAVVDPELTLDLPPAITAATGLDALTQLIEPYVSVRANPFTDLFCEDGIRRVARSLVRAFHDGSNLEARQDMALASLYGGLALANAGLGAVHGFAAPVGGMFPAPHGAVCAALLAPVIEMNLRALRARAPDSPALRRYQILAQLLTGRADARAEDGLEWVRGVTAELGIPRLRSYGIAESYVPELVSRAARATSMRGNPVVLTEAELAEILRAAL
ncbi:MAG: iron-containing alcohol dehydrogenase [Elioraea sp.]|nr:iron-containing alcohol dehydrogenase [Elioraea sp.]MDW8354081.1 iron-containing alcohol dehydrogenase [Bryobacterales bacterium]